jgi:rhamnogalacturonyl hydrolase YesR
MVNDNKSLKLGLGDMPNISEKIASLTKWLVIGPFPNKSNQGMSTAYPPEEIKGVKLGRVYNYEARPLAWTLPKIEVFADVIDPHPLWGTYYSWNYHAAGLAWALMHLGEQSENSKYYDFGVRYSDFIFDIKPFVGYQVNDLNHYTSTHHHLDNTPLLDFTTAPSLPIIYRLIREEDFEGRDAYADFISGMNTYVSEEQVRLPDGTFTRETPEKYTTWVDDMFMGIPYLLHAAKLTDDPKEKQRFFDDAANQVLGFHKRLYDPEANLYSHAHYSERPDVQLPWWSRANGWGIWATSEVLLHLPKKHPKYRQILKIFQNHVRGVVPMQNQETGFWHNVLNKPDSYPETSGTAIFTMAIARGINQGWLKRKTYEATALKGWEALKTVIDEDGTVRDICMGTMCSEDVQYYYDRPKVDNDSHGLLGLIFTGIEMQRLVEGK